MNTDLMFSSKSNEWETPKELFDLLNEEFKFTLDAASTDENHLCEKYYTQKTDGLTKSWAGESAYLNPPYGRGIGKWVKKAADEALQENTSVVCLVPARVDTKWFQNNCKDAAVRLIRGRLKFVNRTLPSWREDGKFKTTGAPFPSMIIILNKDYISKNTSPMSKLFPYLECRFL